MYQRDLRPGSRVRKSKPSDEGFDVSASLRAAKAALESTNVESGKISTLGMADKDKRNTAIAMAAIAAEKSLRELQHVNK